MKKRKERQDDDIIETVERYADTVYKISISYTKRKNSAEDISQEVFLRYMTSNKVFIEEEHKKAWLIRVTINCCKNLLSSVWQSRVELLNSMENDFEFMTKEKHDIFYAVMELPLKYRTVIHLHYYEEMSVLEISKLLHRNKNTILSQLHRSRVLLAEKMKSYKIGI